MKRAPYQYERRVLKCQLHSVLLALDVHCAVRTRQRADGSDMAAGSKRTVIRDMFLPRLLAPPPLLPPPREAVVWSIAMVVLSPRCDVTVEEEEEEAKVARGGPRPRCCAPAPHTRPVPIDSGSRPSAMRSFLHCRIRFKCFYRCAQAKIGSKVAMVLNVCRLGVERARRPVPGAKRMCSRDLQGQQRQQQQQVVGSSKNRFNSTAPCPARKKSTREAQRLWSMSQSQR